MSDASPARWKAYGLYAVAIILPSLSTLYKYTREYAGVWGVLAYSVLGAIAIPFLLHLGLTRLAGRISTRAVWCLVAATLAITIAAFATVYPYAQSRTPGGGSDADDALNIAADELSYGRYPYHQRTYLDHPISPMPGAVLLALPFRFRGMGNAAYQNLFWLAAYVVLAARLTRDIRPTFIHMAMLLVCCPGFLHQVLTGGDWATNSIYVLVFMHFMVRVDPRSNVLRASLAAALFGVALSSRANFVMLVPPLLAALALRYGRADAIRQIAISLSVAAAVTLPFYLHDPAGFSPLHAMSKLRQFDPFLPNAGVLIGGLTCLVAVALAFSKSNSDEAALFRNCACVLAMPVVLGFAVGARSNFEQSLVFMHYGLFCAMFATLAALMYLCRPTAGNDPLPVPRTAPHVGGPA